MGVHPIALLVVLGVSVAILLRSREKLLGPFFFVAVFLPLAQGFDLAGLDMTFARVLIFVGWFRLMIRGELALIRWNRMDTALLVWCLVGSVTYVVLWGGMGSVINRAGQIVNYAGTYFLVRFTIHKTDDVLRLVRVMRTAAILLGIAMTIEWFTARNVFAIFGGVPLQTIVRDGRLRCQGPFGHPIVAGLFGASLAPMFIGAFMAGDRSIRNFLALASSLVIVASASSSGPVLAMIAGLGCCMFWPFRRYTRLASWAGVAMLGTLHAIMEAPVWALIWRVSVFGASTSWHRYNLLNQFLTRYNEWWLVGTKSTAHWGHALEDVANNYVRIGVNGGVFTLLAFFWMMRQGFLLLGKAMRATSDRLEQILLWSLGTSAVVHLVGSLGVSYWDQIIFLFSVLLGLISATSAAILAREQPQEAWTAVTARRPAARPAPQRAPAVRPSHRPPSSRKPRPGRLWPAQDTHN